jgi:hypothetical protein
MSKDFFFKRFTDHLLIHKASGKIVLHFDCHRTYCSSPLLLQAADEYNVIIIRPPSLNTRTLKPWDKSLLRSLKDYFKNDVAAGKVTQYSTARPIGFACSKVASVGFGVVLLSELVFILSTATECLNICFPFLIPMKL